MHENIGNTDEMKIRTFLKTLTPIDIADSVHLFGIDFDTCQISEVVDSMFSLFCEVKTLERMVDNNFQSEDGEKVLMPSTPQTQTVVIQDYYRKAEALNKLLSCEELSKLFKDRLVDSLLENSEAKRVNS